MNKIQTRALVEGAVFAAITVVIGIIRFYIPLIDLISIVWSVPAILIAFRHGLKVSINSVVVSSILVAVITQPIQGLGFFIGFGLPGIFMGYLLKRKMSPGKTILLTSIVLSLCSAVSLYLGMLVTGIDILRAYDDVFNSMKNAYIEALNSAANMTGISHEEILKRTADFEKKLELVKLILPACVLIYGIILSYINFRLTKLVLKRIHYDIEDLKPFSQWRLSNKSMIFVMSMLLCTVVGMYLVKLPQLYALTMNIFILIAVVFMVLGLSVAKFFLDKYTVSKAFKRIILFLLLMAFGNILMFIGISDVLLDFRKLRDKTAEGVR